MLEVSLFTVDGGLQEFNAKNSIIAKLSALRRDDCKGKELIHALFTDDWGAPLVGVKIRGTLDDGTLVDEYIPYE